MSSEFRVFNITTGADTGGWAGRLKDSFDQHPQLIGDKAVAWRSMVSGDNYIDYPYDLKYDLMALGRLYEECDVVVLHNTLHGHDLYDSEGKPTVMMHHGRTFRGGPDVLGAQCAELGMQQLCSTIDLEMPNVTWFPIPYELDGPISLLNNGVAESFAQLRARSALHDGKIRVAHAPTDRAIKSTDHFLKAMARLASKGLPVEAVLIEQKPWKTCLEMKATADILVDQLILGYGCNAVEAWALGMPVVAATTDRVVRARMLDRWGILPFVEATETSLESILCKLVTSEAMRDEYTAIGTAHVRRWHNAATRSKVLTDYLSAAKPTTPGNATNYYLTRRRQAERLQKRLAARRAGRRR